MLTVDCVLPYVANIIETAPVLDTTSIEVLNLNPEMAFMDEKNINVLVTVEPIYNLTTLICMMHDVPLKGQYVIVDGQEYVNCTIPSIEYLIVESLIGFPESKTFDIEVSLNGVHFSDNGLQFKFIENNQVVGADISVGPDTGGTRILNDVVDFVSVNQNAQAVRCLFPGYEYDDASSG